MLLVVGYEEEEMWMVVVSRPSFMYLCMAGEEWCIMRGCEG